MQKNNQNLFFFRFMIHPSPLLSLEKPYFYLKRAERRFYQPFSKNNLFLQGK
jgi:hypothetical protein